MIREHTREIDVFGGRVTVQASATSGRAPIAAPAMLVVCEAVLRRVHDTLTCFDVSSELSRLNADPREEVPASPILRRFAAAVSYAGRLSDGLVDATAARGPSALSVPAQERPALADRRRRWAFVDVDNRRGTIRRPVGVRLDSGGLGKGLAADLLAERLAAHDTFAALCMGDVRVGGLDDRLRPIRIDDPDGGDDAVHTFRLRSGAVATSGVTRRGHHLVDPGRGGRPARTGIVQASAIAPTAIEAEVRAKAALLSGPRDAARYLPHGGVLVLADRSVVVFEPPLQAPLAGRPAAVRMTAA